VGKYKVLSLIYLYSVLSSSIANSVGFDVQLLYRVPVLNIRWIDVGILYVLFNCINNMFFSKEDTFKNQTIISFCFIYLIFETIQLIRSWNPAESGWQVSWFICTLNFFILIDLLTYKIPLDEIIDFLKQFAIWGGIVLLFSNFYLFYSFISGNVVYTDLDVRVAIDILGQKETVSTGVLTPLVYAFGIYFLQKEIKPWEKGVFIATILGIYVSLITEFHRGNLVTIATITLIYIAIFSNKPQEVLKKVFAICFLFATLYLVFGGILRKKGYDPIEKLTETASFALDVDNPNWDKGRSVSREYATLGWQKNVYFGNGYDNLYNNMAMPLEIATAHNFIMTSLFHRGIVGTCIYLIILILLFRNSIRLWFLLKRENSYENDILKLLIIVSFFWLIPFWTEEVIWEKYSLSIQFMYFGFITNAYKQKLTLLNQ
jgi:hypothetical protein